MVMLSSRAYVPPRTAITSPGFALSTAAWMVRSGRVTVPGAASSPFTATTMVGVAAEALPGAAITPAPAMAVPSTAPHNLAALRIRPPTAC